MGKKGKKYPAHPIARKKKFLITPNQALFRSSSLNLRISRLKWHRCETLWSQFTLIILRYFKFGLVAMLQGTNIVSSVFSLADCTLEK